MRVISPVLFLQWGQFFWLSGIRHKKKGTSAFACERAFLRNSRFVRAYIRVCVYVRTDVVNLCIYIARRNQLAASYERHGKHAHRYNTECIHLTASLPDTYVVGNRWEITSLLLLLFTLQTVAYFFRATISPWYQPLSSPPRVFTVYLSILNLAKLKELNVTF